MRDGDLLKTPCGSPNYAAPEVISGQLYAGAEVDVWSCGIILFALLCAKLPFDDDYIPDLFKKIRNGVFTFPPHVTQECKQLIGSMLVVDQLKRSTIAEIREHPWVKKNFPSQLKKIPPIVQYQAIWDVDERIADDLVEVCGSFSVGNDSNRHEQKFNISRDELLSELRKENEQGEANRYQVAYRLTEDNVDIVDGTQNDSHVIL